MSGTQYAAAGLDKRLNRDNFEYGKYSVSGHIWFAKASAGVPRYADPLQNKDFPVSVAGNDRCSA